jgi:choline dehydrogenase-like flavoprotein
VYGFQKNDWLEENGMTEKHDVDVLIVGGGPAGATYARVIADERPHARILIVEVGPHLSDRVGEHVDNLDEEARDRAQRLSQGPDADVRRTSVASQGDNGRTAAPGIDTTYPGLFTAPPTEDGRPNAVGMPLAAMSSGVGGMGVHWAASCPRFIGSERSPLIPAAELDEALAAAERLLNVNTPSNPTPLAAAMLQRVAAEFDAPTSATEPVGFMPSAGERAQGALRPSGISVILGDTLQRSRVELRAHTLARRILVSGKTAVGAELEDRSTGRRYTVHARRVVVTADSLRTPQLLYASGIRPRALGRYFNEHFQMFAPISLDDMLTANATDAPVNVGDSAIVRVPFRDERPFQGQLLSLMGGPLGHGISEPLAVTIWYGAKDIGFDDAVEFDDHEADFYGMPAIKIRYALTERDHRTLDSLKAMCKRTAATVGSLVSDPQLAPFGASLHYQGTVRMGAIDDGTSVCDPFLRVWGIDHLQVGGNGVIETATVANPTLTSVAYAYRAARHLAAGLHLAERASA